MTHTHIGVDISKDVLDLHDPRSGDTQVPNSGAAIRAWLKNIPAQSVLVFEATSRYDATLSRTAHEFGIAFARINPLHGWHFAQSLNLPKTDRIDARMLARFGTERQPAPTPPPDPARRELAALHKRRDQLIRQQTQEKNRLGEAVVPAIRRDIRAMLRSLATRLARIEAEIRAHLARHARLADDARLLRSIPGIGPVAAQALLAYLPQLGVLERRRIASLGGLAPKARESGKYRGLRHIGPGRRQIRRVLYMAALSGLRHPHLFAGQAQRMKALGKPGKVIAIALARKLLTIANAVLRDRTPFQAS